MAGSLGGVPPRGAKDGLAVVSPARTLRGLAAHWVTTLVLALLCGMFAVNAYDRWARTGSLILLGLLLYNALLVAVTMLRRPSLSVSTRIRDWVAAILTVAVSLAFRPVAGEHPVWSAAGSIFQGAGLVIMLVAAATLGTSFGVVAANRGIRRSGLYRWTRHPLYAGELIFFAGFLLANPSLHNLVVALGIACGIVVRAFAEERHLSRDPEYRSYAEAVRYRFFPALF